MSVAAMSNERVVSISRRPAGVAFSTSARACRAAISRATSGGAALLVRLPGGQQYEFGQVEQLGEPAREREMAIVDRVEGAAQQADTARQRGGAGGGVQKRVLSLGQRGARAQTQSRGTRKSLYSRASAEPGSGCQL